MKDEYISRQAAIDTISMDGINCHEELVDIWAIECIPAADVVPVVRCEDCKHHSFDAGYGNYWCNLTSGVRKVKPDDFCSYGERKE